MQIIAIAIAWALIGWKQNTSLRAELSMSVLAFWLVLITILEPAERQARDATSFVSRVEAIRQEQHLPLAFYQEKADVMGKVYAVNAEQLLTPAFIDDLTEIAGFPSGLLLVTQEDITAGLQELDVAADLVATGTMDNAPFLAYIVTPEQ